MLGGRGEGQEVRSNAAQPLESRIWVSPWYSPFPLCPHSPSPFAHGLKHWWMDDPWPTVPLWGFPPGVETRVEMQAPTLVSAENSPTASSVERGQS